VNRRKRLGYLKKGMLRPLNLSLQKITRTQDKAQRLKIIKAIVRIQAPWVSEVLLENLKEPCEEIRDFIVQELGFREDLNLQSLYEKFSSSPWYAKSAALRVASLKKDPNAVPFIKPLIEDPNADVKCMAAAALGEIGSSEALNILVQLTKDSNLYVRKAAEEAIRKSSKLKFS